MSYARRSGGRFTTNTASEAFQRQLTAPVHKWKKAWVAPSGLQPESSYKICKWVRVDQAGEDDIIADGDEEVDEPEDGPAGVEEGDEAEAAADGDNTAPGAVTAGGAADAAAATTTTMETAAAPTPAPSAPAIQAAGLSAPAVDGSNGMDVDQPSVTVVPPSEGPTPAANTPAAPTPSAAATPAPTQNTASNPAADGAATPAALPTAEPITAGEPASQAATPAAAAAAAAAAPDAAAQEHHALPSNAIEMTNTGPSSTEMGQGAGGSSSGGFQITRPEPAGPGSPAHTPATADASAGATAPPQSDAMDVDMEDTAGSPATAGEPVPDRDEGLTMGQPAPGLEKLEAQSEDEPREAAQADE